MAVADPIARLVKELARLPGIGEKTAQRLAFHVLAAGPAYAEALAAAVTGVVRDVRCCSRCQTLTDKDPCAICSDDRRDPRLLCVVEGVPDLVAIERTHEYRGRYHVLHGALSPLDGVGPSDSEDPGAARPARDGAGGRDRHRHEPRRGGGGHRALPGPPAQADGGEGEPHRPGRSHGRRPRIRRPGHAGARHVGAARALMARLLRTLRYRAPPLIGPGIPAIADGTGISTMRSGE